MYNFFEIRRDADIFILKLITEEEKAKTGFKKRSETIISLVSNHCFQYGAREEIRTHKDCSTSF